MEVEEQLQQVSIKMETDEQELAAQETTNLSQFLGAVGTTIETDKLVFVKVESEEQETVTQESINCVMQIQIPFLDTVREMIDDAHFQQMEAVVKNSMTNESYQLPELEQQPLTHKLLLQLELLRQKSKPPWDVVFDLFQKVTDAKALQGFALHSEMRKAMTRGTQLQRQSSASPADLERFLAKDVAADISVRNIGPHLLKHNILRQHLEDPELLKQLPLPEEVTNGMVVDIMLFLRKCGKGFLKCRPLLTAFDVDVSELSDTQLNKQLKIIFDKYTKLKRDQHRYGLQKLHSFLHETITFHIKDTPEHVTLQQRIAQAGLTIHSLRRHLEDKEQALANIQEKCSILQEITREKTQAVFKLEQDLTEATVEKEQAVSELEEKLIEANGKLAACQQQLKEARVAAKAVVRWEKKLADANKKLEKTQQQLKDARATIVGLKKSNYYGRLRRKEMALKKKEEALAAHGYCQKVVGKSKNKEELLKTLTSNTGGNLDKSMETSTVNEGQPEQIFVDLTQNQPQTKKKNSSKYTSEMKETVSQLVAAKVSSLKCSKVIHIVAKHLFQTDMPLDCLPHETTVRKFARESRLLGHLDSMQGTEADTENASNLHGDGTYDQEVQCAPTETDMQDPFDELVGGTSGQDKKDSLKLASEVEKTISELVAAKVSSQTCSKAIQIVAKHLFHTDMPLNCFQSEAEMQDTETAMEDTSDVDGEGTSGEEDEEGTSDQEDEEGTSDQEDVEETSDEKVKVEVPWSVKEEPHDPEAACHTCQHCSAVFMLPCSLKVHLESYHGETPPSE